jgi:hypothetical protein
MRNTTYIKSFRQLLDSEIFSMPPLHLKVWTYLLHKVDYETGEMTATTSQIADAVQYVERNRRVVPARTTIMRILKWLESASMVNLAIRGGRNAQYYSITICKWSLYQISDLEVDASETRKKFASAATVQEGKEVNYLVETKVSTADSAEKQVDTPKKSNGKRDDYIDGMCRYWDAIAPKLKVPHSLFARWRSQYGVDVPLDIIQQIANSGKKLKSPQGYIAKACASEFQRRKQQRIEQPTEDDFASLDALLED